MSTKPSHYAPRPAFLSLLLIVYTIALGLAIRFARLGLPASIVKYGGSMLWAATIYWVLSTILGKTRIATITLASATIATAVELLKLYRTPRLDAFRLTLPGILLLGRIFSWWDVAAYGAAIAVAALIDHSLRPKEIQRAI